MCALHETDVTLKANYRFALFFSIFACLIFISTSFKISNYEFPLKLVRGFTHLSMTSIIEPSLKSGRNNKINVNGFDLAYDLHRSTSSTEGPAIMFLPGLIRQKNEAKSINLQALCKNLDLTFLCADYVGVGRSSGKFSDGTVSKWASDTISLLDALREKKIILVGHGVGAWVSMVVAAKRRDLIKGIVGISADPDFTENLLWSQLSEDVKNKIMTEGVCEINWGSEKYLISKNLIEDGRENLLLTGGPRSIKVHCPVRLIHGLEDEEVPFQLALQLAENIVAEDVSVVLVKGSKHSMDAEADFKTMRSMIQEVIEVSSKEFDLRSPGSG